MKIRHGYAYRTVLGFCSEESVREGTLIGLSLLGCTVQNGSDQEPPPNVSPPSYCVAR